MKNKKLKYPKEKISKTFLDFSSPLVDALGKGATQHEVEKVLQITYTVWNSIVFDTVNDSSEHISKLRQATADDPMISELIEQFISRKKAMFADDLRLIGEYRITQEKGQWRLRAEARDPWTTR